MCNQTQYCKGSVKPHLFSSRFRGLSDWFYLFETKEALISQRKQREPLTKSVWGPPPPAAQVTRGGVNYSGGLRARSDCFKMSLTWRMKKSTCLSLTHHPRWSAFHTTCWPWLCSSPDPLSSESARTRCFPSHVMHLHCATAVMLCLYCRSQTICFWHSSLRLSRRAKDFTCFIVWASWSGFIPACNIGRLDQRKSLVSMSTQLLFKHGGLKLCFSISCCCTHREQSRLVCPYGIACRRAWVLWIMSSWDHGWFGFR